MHNTSSPRFLHAVRAIYLVALSAIFTPATAQKASENELTGKQAELTERRRISSERGTANQELAEQRKACYQKLVVTSCLNDARDQHGEKTRDLKRQEEALNDVKRRKAAADRLSAIDKRNSPEAQLSQAQRRGKALEQASQREASRAQRQSNAQAKQAITASQAKDAATSPAASVESAVPSSPEPKGKSRLQPETKVAPAERPGAAGKMERSRQQADSREKAAEMRRAEAVQREAKRKKPASASLPIQD